MFFFLGTCSFSFRAVVIEHDAKASTFDGYDREKRSRIVRTPEKYRIAEEAKSGGHPKFSKLSKFIGSHQQ